MPRNVTVTFADGSTHVYQNVPDDVTPDQAIARAQKDYGKSVSHIDGGRGQPQERGPLNDFLSPIRNSVEAIKQQSAANRAVPQRALGRSFMENLTNAPRDIAESTAGTLKQGANVLSLLASPVTGAINVATRPATEAASNFLEDIGIHAYRPGGGLNQAPLSREQAAQQLNDVAQQAISLGVPEKAGPPKVRAVKAPKAAPKVSPDVTLLREHGVDVLPGMVKGGAAKNLEDRAAKLPIVGSKIQQARQQSIESFNRAVLNDALKPIGEKLPQGMEAGNAANAHAYDTIQKAYNENKPSRGIYLPEDFGQAAAHPDYEILSPASQQTLNRILDARALSKATGNELTGDRFATAVSGLRRDIKTYGASPDPENQLIGNILKDKLDSLIGEASVQDPAYAARKAALDEAYAKVKTAQQASQSVAADNGVFTPSQYLQAVKKADTSVGKNRFATGRAFNQDLAQAAKNVLSDKVANTGGEAGILGNAIMQSPTAIGAMVGGPVGAGLGFGVSTGGLYGASRLYETAALAKFNASLDRKIAGAPMLNPEAAQVNPGINLSALPPLVAASNIPQLPSFPPLLSRAAAEGPPRKPRHKKQAKR